MPTFSLQAGGRASETPAAAKTKNAQKMALFQTKNALATAIRNKSGTALDVKQVNAEMKRLLHKTYYGPKAHGKASVMRLLGQVYIPEAGVLVVPPHRLARQLEGLTNLLAVALPQGAPRLVQADLAVERRIIFRRELVRDLLVRVREGGQRLALRRGLGAVQIAFYATARALRGRAL